LLWVIPLIRLVLPFGITSKYSLLTLVSNLATRTVVVYEGTKFIPKLSYTNTIMAANQYFPVEYKTNLLEGVFHVASIVWAIIAAAAVLTAILLYTFTKSEFKSAVLYKENIFISDRITSPALYGIVHPKIIIPYGLNEAALNYVIMHEKSHATRYDNLWRSVAVMICCIHWFNPICWLSMRYFFEDMELSCDSNVLRKLTDKEKKEYAYTILNAATQKNLFVAAFGGAKIKLRVENILSYRKLTIVSAFLFTALIVSIFIILVTNAAV
jgi:beta-lactamase regulating signal transducer with metallopeptidase domain